MYVLRMLLLAGCAMLPGKKKSHFLWPAMHHFYRERKSNREPTIVL